MYLKVENLCVGYNGKTLIKDINIEIEKGKILTLIGPNGSGKSTILKSITKHLDKIAGVVYIDHENLFKLSNSASAKKISVVLTERIHPEMMTCEEVVATGRYPYTSYFGKMTHEDKQIVLESMEKVHALDLRYKEFENLSDGQRQRIMLARAICQQPDIIVLDEPTSYLDIRHKIELLNILRKMAKEKNITIIMSLHEIDLAHKVSDYIMCIKGEFISAFGTPEQIFKNATIQELYEIENGSYDSLFGSVELAKQTGNAQVLVICGNGKGIPFYRFLQKKGIPFMTGILFENDIDYQVAKNLASKILVSPAFQPMSENLYQEALEQFKKIDAVIDAGTIQGEFSKFNSILLLEAQKRKIPILKTFEEIILFYEKELIGIS